MHQPTEDNQFLIRRLSTTIIHMGCNNDGKVGDINADSILSVEDIDAHCLANRMGDDTPKMT